MSLPLKGIHILNTRPLSETSTFKKQIESLGGTCVDCPTLVIEPNHSQWFKPKFDLNTVQYAIFTSANAVFYFFKQLQEHQILWPLTIKIIAIGNATAQSITKMGFKVDFLPENADSEHLVALDVLQSIHQQTILLIKGAGGRTLIENTLSKRGAHLLVLPVYIRKSVLHSAEFIASIWRNSQVNIILLTSAEGMNQLLYLFSGPDARTWLCNKTCIVYSERLAALARLQGFKSIHVISPNAPIIALADYQPKD